ncbi:MAG TPA: UDP-N-acetylglucosamine--N-acetylmuramyl-(pentapeptide) pyrophosphoryl-undecaprenol N-acetylglucosamine transferase [Gemmatimonadaceae bacterium]
MNVLFAGGGTGGHLYPALAIARALVRREPNVRPFFIGARRGVEHDVLPGTGFPHILLDLHPLYRSAPWKNGRTLWSVFVGWQAIKSIARQHQARLVVATGGYAAGATIAYAATSRTPLVLQEQNSFAGQTIKMGSRFAREIYLGFPEASRSLPLGARSRCFDTGNPIEPPPPPSARPSRDQARAQWGFASSAGPVVLAFGGSQGSAALNDLIAGWLAGAAHASSDVHVIWATGKDHYDRYAHLASNRVAIRPYLSPIADAYAATDIALTRAGAMTTAELCAWGIPSILVPLPTAAADHQTANAKALEAAGVAIRIDQKQTTGLQLGEVVTRLAHDARARDEMARRALERARPDAADAIATRILSLLNSTKAVSRQLTADS